jgi:hypothetical protein
VPLAHAQVERLGTHVATTAVPVVVASAPPPPSIHQDIMLIVRGAFQRFDRLLAGQSTVLSAPAARSATLPDPSEVRRAEVDVAQARTALQLAEAEQSRARSGESGAELRAAERDFAAARTAVVRAQLGLRRLNGPDPVVLGSAERAVQRAEATLRLMRSAQPPSVGQSATPARPSAIADAERFLSDARARRDSILQGPSPEAVEAARRTLADAQASLAAAEERLLAAQSAPVPSTDDADRAAAMSRIRLVQAESRLRRLLGDRQ